MVIYFMILRPKLSSSLLLNSEQLDFISVNFSITLSSSANISCDNFRQELSNAWLTLSSRSIGRAGRFSLPLITVLMMCVLFSIYDGTRAGVDFYFIKNFKRLKIASFRNFRTVWYGKNKFWGVTHRMYNCACVKHFPEMIFHFFMICSQLLLCRYFSSSWYLKVVFCCITLLLHGVSPFKVKSTTLIGWYFFYGGISAHGGTVKSLGWVFCCITSWW